mmetsp:Transcript_29047/g.47981  ORF Transcript_29047/g.47981 Transcript_29047/m.47981 type:complete len:361 (+) Transcript_29047:74-1156(+)
MLAPPQAAKALKETEAKEKGIVWVDEVSDEETGLFKDYRTWVAVYESMSGVRPATKSTEVTIKTTSSEPTNKTSTHQQESTDESSVKTASGKSSKALNFKSKAAASSVTPPKATRHEAAKPIITGLSNKFVLMTLDTVCHMMQQLETSMPEEQNFINALRALVLSYRFEKPNMRRKLFHLRQVSCERLAELLELKLKDDTLKDTQLACREAVAKLEAQKLFEDEWKAWIADFMIIVDNDDAATTALATPPKMVLDVAGLVAPQEVMEDSHLDVYAKSAEFVKNLVQPKFTRLWEYLSRAIENILMQYATLKFAPDTSRPSLPMKEELVLVVDKQHQLLVESITRDVSGMVDLLDNMMQLK